MTGETTNKEYDPENPEEFDYFAEGLEPDKFEYKLFYLRMPNSLDRKTGDTISCYLSVDQYGYCQLMDWYFFHRRDPHRPYHLSEQEDAELYECERLVWEWLAEWELVELKPIGPEDSEYFATDKLLGGKDEHV